MAGKYKYRVTGPRGGKYLTSTRKEAVKLTRHGGTIRALGQKKASKVKNPRRRKAAKTPKYRCEVCSRPLKKGEQITCQPCHNERIQGLLGSPEWMEVRGRTLVEPDGPRFRKPGWTLANEMRSEIRNPRGGYNYWITYDFVTPESAEYGDVEHRGFYRPGWGMYPSDKYGEEAKKEHDDERHHAANMPELVSDVGHSMYWLEWSSSPPSSGDWLISDSEELEDDDGKWGYMSLALHIERADGKPLTVEEMQYLHDKLGLMGPKPTGKKHRSGKRNPGDWAGRGIDFKNKYLNDFFAEKEVPIKTWTIKAPSGMAHIINSQAVLEHVAVASRGEKKQISDMLRRIDFANGDVNHFLKHLAGAIAASYESDIF